MSYNLPNPSLAGILLAVSTHNGPQIAFSYPENLCIRPASGNTGTGTSDDDEFDDEDFDIAETSSGQPARSFGINGHIGDGAELWDTSHPNYYLGTKHDLMTYLDARESQKSAGNSSTNINTNGKPELSQTGSQILGFEPEQLSEMLCPPRAMCNRRFDVMLENVVFLGLPIHVDMNGSWRPKRRAKPATATATAKSEQHSHTYKHKHKHKNSHSHSHNEMSDDSGTEVADETETEPRKKSGDLAAGTGTSASNTGTAMSMFHLVFVMRPPDIERNYRVDEMFYNVTSKLAFVLRREQQKHDYVWHQVRQISRLKEQFRTELGQHGDSMAQFLISQSPLCKMMADCFSAISASQIANLSINGKPRAFQIPMKTEFHSLPEPTVPYIPGSCLSSTITCLGSAGLVNTGETSRYSNNNLMELLLGMAGPHADNNVNINNGNNNGDYGNGQDDDFHANDDDDDAGTSGDDIVHLSLLLHDEADVIIRDINADPHSAIARFVRMLKPTDSLLKTANNLHLHLHSGSNRGTGTGTGHASLSLAEIKSFALHLVYWRRARVIPPLNTRAIYIVSPMAPIDTNFHRDIARFSQQFPTVPSLPSFLKLLSTRSRKPRQFASIIPSRDHKEMYLLALAWLVRFGYVTQLHTYIWLKVSKKVKMRVEEQLEEELGRAPKTDSRGGNKHPHLHTQNNASLLVDNSSKQIGTDNSVDAEKGSQAQLATNVDGDANAVENAEIEIEKLQKKLDSAYSLPDLVLEDDGDTILVDPGRASSLERKWINKIIHDECKLSPELTAVFYKLLKYMNGKNSLELLLLRENVARGELRKLLSEIDEYIISVRHW